MDFISRVKTFADQARVIVSQKPEKIKTDEATKNFLIIPFIHRVLGYNTFNTNELISEYEVNVENSKKLKLDYAILQSSKPLILVKCKCYSKNLEEYYEWCQLFHFLVATNARIVILTNGIIYKFYADLDKKIKWIKFHF